MLTKLPSKWCIKRTSSNALIINDWCNRNLLPGESVVYSADNFFIYSHAVDVTEDYQRKSDKHLPEYILLTDSEFSILVYGASVSAKNIIPKSNIPDDRWFYNNTESDNQRLGRVLYKLGNLGKNKDNFSGISKDYFYYIEATGHVNNLVTCGINRDYLLERGYQEVTIEQLEDYYSKPLQIIPLKTDKNPKTDVKIEQHSGYSYQVPRKTTTISRGEEFKSSSIKGRASKASITIGHLSYEGISS